MTRARRNRLAWLFALALLAELALLCCASAQISSHFCPGHDSCAICAILNPELHLIFAALALALGMILATYAVHPTPCRHVAAPVTPVALRVRIND